MRKKIIAGNWKMNKTPSEAVELVNMLKPLCANDDVDVVFCVPAIDIIPAVEAAKDSNIAIGEVWLAGGQSNMEFPLSDCTDWNRVSRSPHPNVRFFYTPKFPYVCDEYYEAFDKALGETSFGKWVYKKLGIRSYGSLYQNEETPDGSRVDEAGRKIGATDQEGGRT